MTGYIDGAESIQDTSIMIFDVAKTYTDRS